MRSSFRASESRLRLLVASARDYAVIEMDPDRRIVGWDAGAEQVFGWTADEIVGSSADVLFTQEDRERKVPQEESTIALETGSAANDRWHLKRDGARFWATGALMPVLDSNGGHRGFVKIMRDFTERKLREDESRRATESERNRLEFTIATTRSELQRFERCSYCGSKETSGVESAENSMTNSARISRWPRWSYRTS